MKEILKFYLKLNVGIIDGEYLKKVSLDEIAFIKKILEKVTQ